MRASLSHATSARSVASTSGRVVVVPAPARRSIGSSSVRPATRHVHTFAEPENNSSNNGEGATPSPSTPAPPTPSTPPSSTPPSSKKDEGSTTATVTGAISVVIGVAYLVLVSFLNSRGDLVPPPPEAFGP